MEVCPQFNKETSLVGAATIAQVKLFSHHLTSEALKTERLHALIEGGRIQECGFAQNFVNGSPKMIPLIKAISNVWWP